MFRKKNIVINENLSRKEKKKYFLKLNRKTKNYIYCLNSYLVMRLLVPLLSRI